MKINIMKINLIILSLIFTTGSLVNVSKVFAQEEMSNKIYVSYEIKVLPRGIRARFGVTKDKDDNADAMITNINSMITSELKSKGYSVESLPVDKNDNISFKEIKNFLEEGDLWLHLQSRVGFTEVQVDSITLFGSYFGWKNTVVKLATSSTYELAIIDADVEEGLRTLDEGKNNVMYLPRSWELELALKRNFYKTVGSVPALKAIQSSQASD